MQEERLGMAAQTRFEDLFKRLEPIRELRNHIAHGTMRLGLASEPETWELTLSLPRDLGEARSPEARHVTFKELNVARNELVKLIEEFKNLHGDFDSPARGEDGPLTAKQ